MQSTDLINVNAFQELAHPLCGLPVSRAWRGHGSALFLELGVLTVEGEAASPRGEAGVMIEWSWRVEGPRAIRGGSWSDESVISRVIGEIEGRMVETISVEGRLPEVSIAFSGRRWIRSFMTDEGQPQWTVFLPRGGAESRWITVRNGRLVMETSSSEPRRLPSARG